MASGNSQSLTALLEPVVQSLGCELWGLEYHASGRRRGVLRIFIEKQDGVGLSDCEKVSRQVSSVMDVEDPIQGEYTLEVSSPGTDRPLYNLAQYAQYVGQQVKVKLRVPYEGRRYFSGQLTGIEGDEILVLVEDHEYLFPIDSIDKGNLVPNYSNPQDGKTPRDK